MLGLVINLSTARTLTAEAEGEDITKTCWFIADNHEYIEAIVLVKYREFEILYVCMHSCTCRESFRFLQRNRNLAVLFSSLKLGAFFYFTFLCSLKTWLSPLFFLSLFCVWRCQIHFQLPNSGWWSLLTISFNIAFSIFISFLTESVTYFYFWHLTSFLFFLKTNRKEGNFIVLFVDLV